MRVGTTDCRSAYMGLGYLGGALAALLPLREGLTRAVTAAGAIVGSIAGIGLAARVLIAGEPFALTVPALLSVGGGLALRLDGLGAFFLLLIGVVAAPAPLYGVGYSSADAGRHSLRWLRPIHNPLPRAMSLLG